MKNQYIQYYWTDAASSYAEAKRDGALRTVTHDYLQEQTHFNTGFAADVVELICLGADTVSHRAEMVFFLFDEDGTFLDATRSRRQI
jgi:hypothetical protein